MSFMTSLYRFGVRIWMPPGELEKPILGPIPKKSRFKKNTAFKPRFCPRKAQPMKIIQENRSKVWQELEAGRFFYPLQGTVIHIPTWGKGKSLTYHRLKSDLVGNFSEGIGLSHWIIFPLKKTVKMKKHVESSSPPRFFSGKHPLFQGVIWVEVMQQTLTNWALMNVPFQGASNACLVLSVAPNRMVKVQHRTGFKHFNSCFHVTNFGKNLHDSNPRVMKNAISIVCIHMILHISIYIYTCKF